MTDDDSIAFEYAEDFDFEHLNSCAVGKKVYSRVFVCRHHNYFFKWRLRLRKKKRKGIETFGLYLYHVDQQQEILTATFDLFVGNNKYVVRHHKDREFTERSGGRGMAAFLPSAASLVKHGLVVDGVVRVGVKILLKTSDFDPFKWLLTPSLTPHTCHVVRQLFDNLGTDNHRGTDFDIVVGEGDAKTELHVSSLALTTIPFFRRIFADAESKENKEGFLQLPTDTVDAVREAFRYIYLNEIGEDLTRFLPSILSLASEWDLEPLLTAIERDVVNKLQADQFNFDLAADYLQLADKYTELEVASRVAICLLMDTWPQFLRSPKGKDMAEDLKDDLTCVMAETAVYKDFINSWDPLTDLSAPSLTPNGGVGALLFANLGTDNWRGTDFIIAVGEAKTELHVSSLALSAVPFFDRMFGNAQWKENQAGVLHLPTHTVDAVIEALKFVYLNEVGEDLTRCLPSVLSLASEWELVDLMTYIERDMIIKLQADRFHRDYELTADYLQLADTFDRKVVGRLATDKLIMNWEEFIDSPKGEQMNQVLKDKITIAMAAIAGDTDSLLQN